MFFIVPMVLFLFTSGLANTSPVSKNFKKIGIEKVANAKSFRFELKNGKQKVERIAILDEYGVLLFEENKIEKDYRKVFELSNLPVGEYYFLVSDKEGTMVQPFLISQHELKINEADIQFIFKPKFSQKDDLLALHMQIIGEQKVNVRINDTDGNNIYSNTELCWDGFFKSYDLSALETGEYEIDVKTEFTSFSFIID